MCVLAPPTLHRTETKKAKADQTEGGGFGDGRRGRCEGGDKRFLTLRMAFLVGIPTLFSLSTVSLLGCIPAATDKLKRTDAPRRADAGVEFTNGKRPGVPLTKK
jgi:hypothetical protein